MAIFNEVVDIDTAKQEVTDFLDAKRVRPARREAIQSAIDVMVEGVQYGFLTIEPNVGLTVKLDFPMETSGTPITEIKFSWRVAPDVVQTKMANTKPDQDGNNKLLAIIHAYTTIAPAIVNKLEPSDNSLVRAIACIFFPQ